MTNSYRVYCYTNLITEQKYIGCTSLKYQSHRAGTNGHNYIKMCSQFGHAIEQYGWDNFQYEVLENNLTKEQAELREQFWISELGTLFPSGYNLQNGSKRNYKQNETSKQKMSKSHYLCREKTSERNKQMWSNQHLREAQSTRMKSFYSNVENRRKTGESRKGKFWWTDGIINKYSAECPGLNFHRGMTKLRKSN